MCSAASPHTTRPSSSSDDRISPWPTQRIVEPALGRGGPLRLRAREQRAGRRRRRCCPTAARSRRGCRACDRAIARSCALAGDKSSRHDSALSTSDDGMASRRAMLPSVSHANPDVGVASGRLGERQFERPAHHAVDDDRQDRRSSPTPSCRCGTARWRCRVTRCADRLQFGGVGGQADGAAQHEALPWPTRPAGRRLRARRRPRRAT